MEIDAVFEEAGEAIVWHCAACGDQGRIYGWQGTPWDRGRSAHGDASGAREGSGDSGHGFQSEEVPASRVRLEFTARERELLDSVLIDLEYLERMRRRGKEYVAAYTLDELDDLLGYVAAGLNHAPDRVLEDEFEALFNRLAEIEDVQRGFF